MNRRSTASEIDFYLEDAEAKAIVYEDASAAGVAGSALAQKLPRIALDPAPPPAIAFAELTSRAAPDAAACVNAEAWSVMLYTSGTTARPKGVPRRQHAERAAALAHVAQNLYAYGERTLGVMPLYHTMGVRSLLAMSLIGGASSACAGSSRACAYADRSRARHQPLSGADTLSRPGASPAIRDGDVSSCASSGLPAHR